MSVVVPEKVVPDVAWQGKFADKIGPLVASGEVKRAGVAKYMCAFATAAKPQAAAKDLENIFASVAGKCRWVDSFVPDERYSDRRGIR